VLLYSGATWKEIGMVWSDVAERGFGISVCPLGDIDKDGVGDFAVGACKWTWPNGPAFVFVYSGKTHQLLRTLGPPGR
jgi:hypothetical protein